MACGLASADSIVSVSCGTAGPGSTELGVTPSPAATSGLLTCAGANLGAGFVLTGAVLTINGSILDIPDSSFESYITLTNNNAVTQSGFADQQSFFHIDPTSENSLSNFTGIQTAYSGGPPPSGGLFSVTASTGTVTLAPGQSEQLFISGSGSSTGTDTNGTDLANWEATNATAFSFIADTATLFTSGFGGGTGGSGQATYAEASATVTYYYEAVSTTPEPTTMALMGGALIGLGLIGKRFKKS